MLIEACISDMTVDDCEVAFGPVTTGDLPTVRVAGQRERIPLVAHSQSLLGCARAVDQPSHRRGSVDALFAPWRCPSPPDAADPKFITSPPH